MRAFLAACALVVAAASASADCLPAEVGGYGRGFRITTLPAGTIYTWHCPAGQGWAGVRIVVHAEQRPAWPPDRVGRLVELSRLGTLYGYSADAGTFLAAEAAQVLAQTVPRKGPYED